MGALIKTNLEVGVSQRRDAAGEKRRNVALQKAIEFAKILLLTNVVYFSWRWINVLSNIPSSNGYSIAAYIGFLLVEGTFGGKKD